MTKKREHFDINAVDVRGTVQKIWDWDDDIFFSLAIIEAGKDAPRLVTNRVPQGLQHGKLVALQPRVALQPGTNVHVQGYLADAPFDEPLTAFLKSARAKSFLDEIPAEARQAWINIRTKRVDTRLEVTALSVLDEPQDMNTVQLQGVAVKVWRSGGSDLFARLAVYDQHAHVLPGAGKNGLPRRKPHYVTVRFVGGAIDGQPVLLTERQRLRVSGQLHINFYRQSLHEILLRARQTVLIDKIPIDTVSHIAAVRTSLSVLAQSVIVLGHHKTKQPEQEPV